MGKGGEDLDFPFSKLWSGSDIEKNLSLIRSKGLRIVLCHGVFDVLHPGHVDHLSEAKSQGDFLVVSVTTDAFVNKGPGRPFHGIGLRLKMLAALESVDAVFESVFPTAVAAIEIVQPSVFVKGPDYQDTSQDLTGNIEAEIETVVRFGGTVHFTSAPALSSSRLINRLGTTHSSEAEVWLGNFRMSHSEVDIAKALDAVSGLKVIVVGELIVDRYVFCEALGKTSKEPVLAFLEGVSESQVGGSLAIAKHVAGLGAVTTLVSRIGRDSGGELGKRIAQEGMIRFVHQESPHQKTIVKTRYLDSHTGTKVFETYQMTDDPPLQQEDEHLAEILRDEIRSADLVLVADYGHGLMSDMMIQVLSGFQGLVSVNTQSNAGNRGFNSVSRYPRTDIVSLNGGEVSLELRKKHSKISELVTELGDQTAAKWVVVTEGSNGVSIWSKTAGVCQIPAFTQDVKDRVGAGDALFAMVSLLLSTGAKPDIVGFLGNLAGAALVSDLGNRYSLSAVDLLRHSSALLK